MSVNQDLLALTPSVPVWYEDGEYIFDRKFYDGVMLYMQEWDGDILCIMRLSVNKIPPFGVVKKKLENLPFRLKVLYEGEKISIKHLLGSKVVLASGDSFEQFHLSHICKAASIKCIYIIEYIPETRYQIVSMQDINPLVKLRRYLYVFFGEFKRRKAFELADGLQANGAAAFEEYNNSENCIRYFDNRIYKKDFITEEELSERTSKLKSLDRPLRLAFSGRIEHMKGADHLVDVANRLKKKNIDFLLEIYGTGELESTLRTNVEDLGLMEEVKFRGAVDFYDVLLPELKESIDIYVILHRQSDPSCTYLETLACGIPIVGYKNKAFSGLLNIADIGWGVEMNNVDNVVKVIENLNSNREEIVEKSVTALNFSKDHDFETTFKKRIYHLKNQGRP